MSESEGHQNPPRGGTDSLIEGMRSTKDGSGAWWGGGGVSAFGRGGRRDVLGRDEGPGAEVSVE